MFSSKDSETKNSFLEQTKAAREERAFEKKRENAVIIIQSRIRGWLAKQKYKQTILLNFDNLQLNDIIISTDDTIELISCILVYKKASQFLTIFNADNDAHVMRFEILCRYLLISLESDSQKKSYIGVALNNEFSLLWIRHIKFLLYQCCICMGKLKPENHCDSLKLALFLRTIVAFTSSNTWTILKSNSLAPFKSGMNQLCKNIMGYLVQKGFFEYLREILIKGTCKTQVTLKPISLAAIITLSIRPLIAGKFSDNLMILFIVQILSAPGLIYHVEKISNDCLQLFHSNEILVKCLNMLDEQKKSNNISAKMQGTQLLGLIANLAHLFYLEPTDNIEFPYPQYTYVVMSILRCMPNSVGKKNIGPVSQWHELLGWFSPNSDTSEPENLSVIKIQLQLLWCHRAVRLLLGEALKSLPMSSETVQFGTQHSTTNIFKKMLDYRSNQQLAKTKPWIKHDSEYVCQVSLACALYHEALITLPQLKLDILSGLCYNDTVLHDLFLLIASIGPNCGMKFFLEMASLTSAPHTYILLLFCDLMTHYVTILDDIEMYEQQTPFKITDYIGLSYFLNNFLYKTILNDYDNHNSDPKAIVSSPIFVSLHTLLSCLYRRDSRRQFASPNHWLIAEIKPSHFLSELEKGRKQSQLLMQKMPHIIPHDDRVKLFRKYVQKEKSVLGLTESACTSPSSALITVHRDRIVEDGYSQLALLPAHALKGVIRVRFINQQGLDEAGIDQDGVFKEFLEETIKRVFDPSLNLFKTTTDERLYPSPTSHLQENHLKLFEFIGRMLGKAVYEGIVVDVPFASFFLSQLLGQTQQVLYSCIDELPSLDQELYRNLTFVKHFKGDVSELDLTFSIDEDQMGKIVTHELYPGGRATAVTNENRINYIHYMAYFRMHTQIREQTSAFIRGFKSIVHPDWLLLFSTPELQRLISGDIAPLDLKDLRKHTQYYGGFHDSHRVINWLWDILAQDFNQSEHKLFLKFVTSCSKSPLLGFAHLEPPFSIRCIEVGDDEDTGDTIGSVIRGFFTIRKKDPQNRLPTSSTCFNLLKLPNYQKKSTLRDKLRYAVSSNTGFELS